MPLDTFYPLLPDEKASAPLLERARFTAMMGLPPRMARRVLASLLAFGVLREDSSRSPIRFAIPLASLRWLFPRLWPEAEEPEA